MSSSSPIVDRSVVLCFLIVENDLSASQLVTGMRQAIYKSTTKFGRGLCCMCSTLVTTNAKVSACLRIWSPTVLIRYLGSWIVINRLCALRDLHKVSKASIHPSPYKLTDWDWRVPSPNRMPEQSVLPSASWRRPQKELPKTVWNIPLGRCCWVCGAVIISPFYMGCTHICIMFYG